MCYFGDVPLMTGEETISEAEQRGRTPIAELKPLVYEDFDRAIESLPVDYGKESVHFTKGAAMAMKARYALYFGDFDIAAAAAKACMDLNIYSLEPNFADVFLQRTKQIPEKVFCIPRSHELGIKLDEWFVKNGLPRCVGGYGSDNPSWDLLASFLCTDGKPIDESPLFDPRNPFKNRDPRCSMTIVEFGTEHCGVEYQPRMDVTQVMNYTTGQMISNQDNRKIATYSSYNGLVWKKGVDISWTENFPNVETDWIMIRYAEVLLTYAEAKIELGQLDESVVNAINDVRARAYGVTRAAVSNYPAVALGTQEEMRKAVRIERRMETAKEGLRYMDLIRWRLAEKALNGYNYINLQPDDCLANVVNKGLWLWSHVPQVDEDGLVDFSALYTAGTIALGAKRVFPARQYLWPNPTRDIQLCPNLKNNEGY